MSKKQKANASCLCGDVVITANQMDPAINVCHCSMCRKWSGPLLATHCGSDVDITTTGQVSTFSSSAWAERAFCQRCGTHLYYKMMQNNEYIIPIGLFDNIDQVTIESQIFIDEKPSYYSLANQTKTLTGAEIFAMYAPKE